MTQHYSYERELSCSDGYIVTGIGFNADSWNGKPHYKGMTIVCSRVGGNNVFTQETETESWGSVVSSVSSLGYFGEVIYTSLKGYYTTAGAPFFKHIRVEKTNVNNQQTSWVNPPEQTTINTVAFNSATCKVGSGLKAISGFEVYSVQKDNGNIVLGGLKLLCTNLIAPSP